MWTAMSWASSGGVRQLDDDAVDAAVVLHVQVRVEDVAGRGLETDDLSELDVLLEGDVEVLDGRLALVDRVLAVAGHQGGQLVDQVDKVRALGPEVGLRTQLDQGDSILAGVGRDGHRAFLALAPGPLGRLAEAPFAQPLHGLLAVCRSFRSMPAWRPSSRPRSRCGGPGHPWR